MNRLRPLCHVVMLALGFAAAGCGGRSPEDPIEAVLLALSEPGISPAQLGVSLMEVLDRPTIEALEAHAASLSRELGVEVRPDEMLLVQGLSDGLRLRGVESVFAQGSNVSVKLTFGVVGPPKPLLPDAVLLAATDEGKALRLSLRDVITRHSVKGDRR